MRNTLFIAIALLIAVPVMAQAPLSFTPEDMKIIEEFTDSYEDLAAQLEEIRAQIDSLKGFDKVLDGRLTNAQSGLNGVIEGLANATGRTYEQAVAIEKNPMKGRDEVAAMISEITVEDSEFFKALTAFQEDFEVNVVFAERATGTPDGELEGEPETEESSE